MFNLLELKSLIYVGNFNTGFPSYIADVIIHLSQWQFWFWFWFSIFWILFILLILKIFFYQPFNSVITVNTSLRTHGKWGDFIAAVLPLTWCSGILINSNFILRMLEWQHENSLFTLRIHGRQWYWVFKYDLRGFLDSYNTKQRIGHNLLNLENKNININNIFTYISLFYSMFSSYNTNIYWNKYYNKFTTPWLLKNYYFSISSNNFNYSDYIMKKFKFKLNFIKISNNKFNIKINNFNNFKNFTNISKLDSGWDVKWGLKQNIYSNPIKFYKDKYNDTRRLLNIPILPLYDSRFLNISFIRFTIIKKFSTTKIYMVIHRQWALWLFLRNPFYRYKPSFIFNTDSLYIKKNSSSNKIMENRVYYIRKLHKAKKNFSLLFRDIQCKNITYLNKNNLLGLFINHKRGSFFNIKILSNNKFLKDYDYLLNNYKLKKKQKKRNEIFKLSMSKRLLKVRKIIILPNATNISLVTSSYDVAHSLFIPAIGLKFDCVPGRATHHTLNIIHKGVYYAQCAEICGRYHHHMPAKIGVVFFEQFINWWKSKSLKIFVKYGNLYKNNFYIMNYYFTKF